MCCMAVQLWAQPAFNERPKLVVGIVVDQMRWDYLSRYYDKFGDDGFRRLIDKGYSYDNCKIKVKGVLPGQTVELRIKRSSQEKAEGTLLQVLTPSPIS